MYLIHICATQKEPRKKIDTFLFIFSAVHPQTTDHETNVHRHSPMRHQNVAYRTGQTWRERLWQ